MWAKKRLLFHFFNQQKQSLSPFYGTTSAPTGTRGERKKKKEAGKWRRTDGHGERGWERKKTGKQDRREECVIYKGRQWNKMENDAGGGTQTHARQSDARGAHLNFAFYLTGNQRKGRLAAASWAPPWDRAPASACPRATESEWASTPHCVFWWRNPRSVAQEGGGGGGGGGDWEGRQATRKLWREGTGGEMSSQFCFGFFLIIFFFYHPCQDSLTPFPISLIGVFGECGLWLRAKHMQGWWWFMRRDEAGRWAWGGKDGWWGGKDGWMVGRGRFPEKRRKRSPLVHRFTRSALGRHSLLPSCTSQWKGVCMDHHKCEITRREDLDGRCVAQISAMKSLLVHLASLQTEQHFSRSEDRIGFHNQSSAV